MAVSAPAEQTTSQATTQTVLRSLCKDDYDKGFMDLLGQLTIVGNVSQADFDARFKELKLRGDDYQVVVIEDTDKQRIIGTATMFVELKFLRNCGKVGHIEDVVVHPEYRGLRLGQRLIEELVQRAASLQCYKIILDCAEHNVAFYGKCGLVKKEVQMVKYFENRADPA